MLKLMLLTVIMTGCAQPPAPGSSNEAGPRAILYEDGLARHLDSLPEAHVRALLDTLFAGAADALRLAVTPHTTDPIRQDGTALEIVYPEPATFQTPHGTRTFTHLLIPLSGEYAPSDETPRVVLFLGGDEGHDSGPLIAAGGREVVARLYELLRLKADLR